MLNIVLQHTLDKHLAKHPDAKAFLAAYGQLCHAVDDLVDRDNPEIKDYKWLTVDAFNLAIDVYSSPFYHANISMLYPLVKQIHRVWSDSLVWEKSSVTWQREYADKLRCCGNEIAVAILEHLCHLPYEELRRVSILIREDSWSRHHTAAGQPV